MRRLPTRTDGNPPVGEAATTSGIVVWETCAETTKANSGCTIAMALSLMSGSYFSLLNEHLSKTLNSDVAEPSFALMRS